MIDDIIKYSLLFVEPKKLNDYIYDFLDSCDDDFKQLYLTEYKNQLTLGLLIDNNLMNTYYKSKFGHVMLNYMHNYAIYYTVSTDPLLYGLPQKYIERYGFYFILAVMERLFIEISKKITLDQIPINDNTRKLTFEDISIKIASFVVDGLQIYIYELIKLVCSINEKYIDSLLMNLKHSDLVDCKNGVICFIVEAHGIKLPIYEITLETMLKK